MTLKSLPSFSLQDQDGATISQQDFADRKTILYAYPKDFTPGCTTESLDFAHLHADFNALGYDVVGISPDSVDRHERFRREKELPFRLISDPEHQLLEAIGAWGEKKNYGKVYTGVIRSTIVVGPDLAVLHAWNNVRAKGHAERVLRALQH